MKSTVSGIQSRITRHAESQGSTARNEENNQNIKADSHVRRSREVRMVVSALSYIQKVTRHTHGRSVKKDKRGVRGGERRKREESSH